MKMERREFIRLAAWTAAGAALPGCRRLCGERPILRFGMVTDCHFADRDPNLGLNRWYREAEGKLADCVRVMNAESPDFLVELGDFKDKGCDEAETLLFTERIERTFAGFSGPRHHVLGNHDEDAISKEQFLARVSNDGFAQALPHYSFEANGVTCIVLDANYNIDRTPYRKGNFDWRVAVIPVDELRWLERTLDAAKGPVVVFCHQRLDTDGDLGVKNAAQVRARLERSGKVVGVFTGHEHEGAYSFLNGIGYYTLKGLIEGQADNAFAITEVYASGRVEVKGFRTVTAQTVTPVPADAAAPRPSVAAGPTPNYWCTWGIQNALSCGGIRSAVSFGGDQGGAEPRDKINADCLFGEDGWARRFYPNCRSDLYVMLDDGWDVPYKTDANKFRELFGSLEPDAVRFGAFGKTPSERLKRINRELIDLGWQGAGLWVCSQSPGENRQVHFDDAKSAESWKRRLAASAAAGIGYWKIDWGCRGGNEYRRPITELKNRIYPELVVEHKPMRSFVFNGYDRKAEKLIGDGRLFTPESLARTDWSTDYDGIMCSYADVLRIYDMMLPVEGATAMERLAYYSRIVDATDSKTVLNAEGAVIQAAVLGHAFGVMRAPGVRTGLYGAAPDVSRLCERLAEVDRALAWQRYAPVFGGRADAKTLFSETTLTDRWTYLQNEGWYRPVWGREVWQTGPAVLSRGLPLPSVKTREAEAPFVAACRHPNGALAVGAFQRMTGGRFFTPLADVTVEATLDVGKPLGVFGTFGSLTVKTAVRGCRVFARDLAGGPTLEITSKTNVEGGRLAIDGGELARVGSMAAPSEPSAPGALVWIAQA